MLSPLLSPTILPAAFGDIIEFAVQDFPLSFAVIVHPPSVVGIPPGRIDCIADCTSLASFRLLLPHAVSNNAAKINFEVVFIMTIYF